MQRIEKNESPFLLSRSHTIACSCLGRFLIAEGMPTLSHLYTLLVQHFFILFLELMANLSRDLQSTRAIEQVFSWLH